MEARCKRAIFSEKEASWSAFCASLDFISFAKTWLFFGKTVRPQAPLTFPLQHNGVLLAVDTQGVEHLAPHFRTRLGFPDQVPPPVLTLSSHTHPIAKALLIHELTAAIAALPVGKSTGDDDIPNEFLKHFLEALFLRQTFNNG